MKYVEITLATFFVSIMGVFFVLPVYAQTAEVEAQVQLSVCGNSIAESGEECDQEDLNSKTCQSQGHGPGTLTCDIACDFDYSACSEATPSPTPTPSPEPESSATNTPKSSSKPKPKTPTCNDTPPGSKTPFLYSALSPNGNSIMLYFAEGDNPYTYYALEYGRKSGEYIWGSTNIGGKGVRTYLVQSLIPNTTYYFRVRAGNGCAPGPWSNEISSTTLGIFAVNQLQINNPQLEFDPTPVRESTLGLAPVENSNETGTPTGTSSQSDDEEQGTGQKYILNIHSVDPDKNPVSGAEITLFKNGTLIETKQTSENGSVRFTNLASGEYRLEVVKDSFQGEQSLVLNGQTEEFTLNVTIDKSRVVAAPILTQIVTIIIGVYSSIMSLLIRIITWFTR